MRYFFGIDIGGTNVEIGLVTLTGTILEKTSIKTYSSRGAQDTFERIWKSCKGILNIKKVEENEVVGIGMGIPGPVINNSIVAVAANFSWGNNFNAKELMENISGRQVFVGNDVKLISLAEYYFGATKDYKNSINIAIGTGIASGIIIDGKILNGCSGIAGEFGHIVIDENGRKCGCGLKGCLETYCSAKGIVETAKEELKNFEEETKLRKYILEENSCEAKIIFELAKEKDLFCMKMVDSFCKNLAKGLGGIINVINPEIIIFTGGVSKARNIILEGLEKYLPLYSLEIMLKNLKLDFGVLGTDAGILGAATLIIQKTLIK